MSDEAAVRAFPALTGLVAIRDAGWRFVHHDVVDGIPARVDGYRLWPDGWHDALRVHGDSDAMALRADGDEPPGIVWERTGSLSDVVEGLMSLPAPTQRFAPRLVVASAPALWTP
ncbi:hypothetical protein GCM10022243_66130 [Saccharothrix violaceirubra]|uniref:Uncharacterized protein n=1 Tax=Saccharothrix violaceirubra TaxID=413306 RepID=A0A7W7T971_9PSEU|nr:hypothetical protein [Saccharothrix violaceirubra]MBB4968902.1 hypothetical protein [Saccharothrix violaceirubra]